MKTIEQEKLTAAYNLLGQNILSIGAFENMRTLIKGIDQDIDGKLEKVSKILYKVQKLQSGDVVTLSAENLSEETEEKKKRKKIILFLIQEIKDLRSEIQRIQNEFSSQNNSSQSNVWHIGRIIKFAKGPFGLTTFIAAAIVVGIFVFTPNKTQNVSTPIKIISITPSVTQVQKISTGPVKLSDLILISNTATHSVGNETLSAGCSGGTVPGITDSANVTLSSDLQGFADIKIVVSRGTFIGSVAETAEGKLELDVTNGGASRWRLTGIGSNFSGVGTTTIGACTISAPETLVFSGSGLNFAGK